MFIIAHHTNKPPGGREKPNWKAGDMAYLGAGSAEWCNWARADLALRSIGSHEVFELCAGKRGSRLGWEDADGQRSYKQHLAHSQKGICWVDADPNQVPQTGRPKGHSMEELLSILPAGGLQAKDWTTEARTEIGMSEPSYHRARRELEASGRILKSKASGKWMPKSL